MVVLSPVFAVLSNRWSLKWVLVLGTIGFAPYSASLYCNSVYGTQWFLLFGAATCGISVGFAMGHVVYYGTYKKQAAALWVSEPAIGVGYPEENRKAALSESTLNMYITFYRSWLTLKLKLLSGSV